MSSKSTNLKHKIVTDFDGFSKLFAQVEAKNLRFRLLSRLGDASGFIWPCLIGLAAIGVFALRHSFVLSDALLLLLGVFALQVIFIAAHFESHALFFDYEDHVPGSRLVDRTTVYFAAFLHHHMSMRQPWFPRFAYSNSEGYNNIAIAHWVSFSVLFGPLVWLPAALALLNSKTLWFFLGYEIGAYLLPYAHGFQHAAAEKMGAFPLLLMRTLCALGLVASPEAHRRHHDNRHRTVYQDFSSSGLYLRALDDVVNKAWDAFYFEAERRACNLYDLVHPKVMYVYTAVLFILPAALAGMVW
jgi:hypothetical protein